MSPGTTYSARISSFGAPLVEHLGPNQRQDYEKDCQRIPELAPDGIKQACDEQEDNHWFAEFLQENVPDTFGFLREQTVQPKLGLPLNNFLLAQPGVARHADTSTHIGGSQRMPIVILDAFSHQSHWMSAEARAVGSGQAFGYPITIGATT
jgi:hypothetical protein